MFFFTHLVEPCFSTMTLMVDDFRCLYEGPAYRENKALSAECPLLHRRETVARCEALCECAFVREIMQIILVRQRAARQVRS